MHLTGRLTVAVTAMLAGSLLAIPPAHAASAPDTTCFSGSRTSTQDGYHLSGNPCEGWGYFDTTILIQFGPAAGTYLCHRAFVWNGFLSADGCRQE